MVSTTSNATFPARYDSLVKIGEFVIQASRAACLDSSAIYAVQLAVDEACTNIIEHAYGGEGEGDIECTCTESEDALTIQFHDHGRPFRPEQIPEPDIGADLTERTPGGLGLYFMRRLMDEVHFEFGRGGRGNTLTMIKRKGIPPSVQPLPPSQSDWSNVIQLGERIISLDNLPAQLRLLRESVETLVGGQTQLWMDPTWVKGSASPVEETYPDRPPTELMCCTLKSCHPCRGDEALALPIISRQAFLGILQIEHPKHAFDDLEVDLLTGLAIQAALALQASRQTEIERWRIEQLSLVGRVSAQIANVFDVDELARRVTALILNTFKYYYAAVFTLEPGQEALKFRGSAGPLQPSPGENRSPAISVRFGHGIIGQAVKTGIEILANDVSHDSRFQPEDSLPETRAEVALPLKIGDRLLGVLDVQSEILDSIDQTDMLVLRALTDNIAIAVEGASLYGGLRRRAEQLASVAEVSNAISSILNFEELLAEVVATINHRLGYPFLQIFTINTVQKKIIYQAGSGARSQEFIAEGFSYDLDDPQGLIPWVARNAETVLVNDVNQEPRYRPSGDFPAPIQAELVVPLIFGKQVQGILDVQSDRLNAFSEDDQFLFEALADNIAVAIRNANLYRSELWRRQVADSLREVSGLLSANTDLDQVLEVILTKLEWALSCDAAAIWLLEDSEPAADGERIPPTFRLAAIHSQNKELTAEIVESALDCEPGSRTWLDEALRAEQPLIRNPQSPFEPFGAALSFPAEYSAIAAPLHAGEQRLGVLTLAHHAPNRYGAESQAMTATFASYAAVAIQNTQLYEAAHEQAWISTVLLQVAEATQSLTDIDELLATVVEITPTLAGVNACALMVWDENAEAFVPAGSYGLTPEQEEDFDEWIVEPGEDPAFDQLRVLKSPTLLPSWSFYTPPSPENPLSNEETLAKPLVLFPMVVHGEVLGGLLVDFSAGPAELLREEFLQDEKLAIIQGIVHQTASAVENIRLLKSQKEEAYVSVALLQVAQAIVSLTDLNEILESIVRIAPILVGVEHSLIYLWDEASSSFWLAQSYGLSRPVENLLNAQAFSPGEFAILDIAREQNRLIYCPLHDAPPEQWNTLSPVAIKQEDEIPAAQSEPSNSQEVGFEEAIYSKELLKNKERLVLAFPLSVKGTVLGVMLVEETEPTPDEPSYYIRQRRLEILTGITQQAAMAIQNDRLQSEVVERERLEREMQLARQIQKTFLPQRLPELPGWEVAARWQPARQVGGDFYDIIELQGNRIGLVIADVADKGMPAALFMTLVRTLIRAAIHDDASPAAVLNHVNRLLLPDTQNGMFVTVVYAVLSTDTGRLIYANAGHNLPLRIRADNQQVESFPRGGMALGVLEDVGIQDQIIDLEEGDCLILYTDGVTEAFSPADEMFGEAHLHEVLTRASPMTGKEALDAIENAVVEFIADLPQADDITLVAVRRLHRSD